MKILLSLLLAAPFLFGQAALAQGYPERVVRLVVPFSPGGATDVTARLFAAQLTETLKQSVIVENRPGATGAIGIDLVAKASPDGYTLGVGGVGPIAILPIIDPKLPYNPDRDLDIVAGLSAVDFLLLARPGFAPNDIKELIAYAKANPDKVTYGTAGVAGPQQLHLEHLAMLSGVKLFHVPFSGDSQSMAALAAGDIDIALIGVATGLGLVKTGKLKPLAMAGSARSAALPDLPTVVEQTGFSDFTGYTWNILVAPKGTPADVVARLNAAVNEIGRRKGVIEKLDGLGLRPLPGNAQDISGFIAHEVEKNRRIIAATGIRRE